MTMTSQIVDMAPSSVIFDIAVFLLLLSLVAGPSFMSVSVLVVELWQFLFIRDWPEIKPSEITPTEFHPISGDWSWHQTWHELLWWKVNAAKCQGYTAVTVSTAIEEGGEFTKLFKSSTLNFFSRLSVCSLFWLTLIF